jgi:hypothetical protein
VPDTIDFLERLGQDARLRHATDDEIRTALADAGIDPAAREAIVDGDQRSLEAQLAARASVCCLIWAPLRPQEEEEDDAPQDVPQGQDGPKSQQQRRVA